MRIFVGNLAFTTTEDELEQLFGTVLSRNQGVFHCAHEAQFTRYLI